MLFDQPVSILWVYACRLVALVPFMWPLYFHLIVSQCYKSLFTCQYQNKINTVFNFQINI
ncbi:hypothetical protein M408DRAFT_288724 [Serendipita vermifera MAFF 305830]|uniref:Uncharacterized protein n=1 Tax=Serendipita vermifera MAFF 305830 TaxID=933852 RepID=A0A0C3BGR9_SERVB|nr:hypothetical protein M408DRAFT_288724 [Serendipita vermifera MAFF 305830]